MLANLPAGVLGRAGEKCLAYFSNSAIPDRLIVNLLSLILLFTALSRRCSSRLRSGYCFSFCCFGCVVGLPFLSDNSIGDIVHTICDTIPQTQKPGKTAACTPKKNI